eukprot:4608543-Prymnesium_polylepis.2
MARIVGPLARSCPAPPCAAIATRVLGVRMPELRLVSRADRIDAVPAAISPRPLTSVGEPQTDPRIQLTRGSICIR